AAGSAGRRKADAADADGSGAAALPRAARRTVGAPQGDSREGVERPRGHRYARHRQLHRPAAALYRGRTGKPEAPPDDPRRRLPVRGESRRRVISFAAESAMPFVDTSELTVIERKPGWFGRYFHSP